MPRLDIFRLTGRILARRDTFCRLNDRAPLCQIFAFVFDSGVCRIIVMLTILSFRMWMIGGWTTRRTARAEALGAASVACTKARMFFKAGLDVSACTKARWVFKAGLDVSAIHLAVAVEIKQPDFQLLGERHGAEQRDDGARREQQLERVHVRLASAGDDRGIVVWAQAVEDDTDEVERLRAGLGCVRPCAVRVVAVEEPGHCDLSSGATYCTGVPRAPLQSHHLVLNVRVTIFEYICLLKSGDFGNFRKLENFEWEEIKIFILEVTNYNSRYLYVHM